MRNLSLVFQANWSCFAKWALRLAAALTVGICFFLEPVLGQVDWPHRPVTIVVGYPAGSASDALARTLTTSLSRKLGQPFIVEDRGGVDGIIAGRDVAKAEPNGYTIGFPTTTSLALAVNLQPNLGFDPRTDYAPVSLVGRTAYLLVVSSELGVNSLPELVALARSKPGVLNYSSTGVGSIAHLGMLMLEKKLGITMTHVPYKSTGQSIIDVAGGQIQLQLGTIAPTLPLYKAGKVRILGIADDHRSSVLPDVPTLEELGVPDFTVTFSVAMVVPARTPSPIVNQLSEAVNATLKEPAVKNSFSLQGVEAIGSSPTSLASYMQAEIEMYHKIVTEFGITLQ